MKRNIIMFCIMFCALWLGFGVPGLNQSAKASNSTASGSERVCLRGEPARYRSRYCSNLLRTDLAQQGVNRGPITAPLDPELEKQSKNSLEVAKYYFYKRKPPKGDKAAIVRLNKAIEDRLQEIIDLNPTFAKMDEVYFLLGEVYTRGDDVERAREFYTRVVKEFPDSQILGEAKKRLTEIEAQGKVKKEG